MWIVNAKPPTSTSNQNWDFHKNYFPRKVISKKDALQLAEETRRKGGKAVTIAKAK